MIKFINNFLNKRKQNKLANKIAVLQEQAMIFQRNGNLRMYAEVMKQISVLEEGVGDDQTS